MLLQEFIGQTLREVRAARDEHGSVEGVDTIEIQCDVHIQPCPKGFLLNVKPGATDAHIKITARF